ncbi:NAD-dependent epimerase/dehydratase family protein, partial [bacterium]|nr:NAD-dependent epimerase/dehydratase family protein [bacterium]
MINNALILGGGFVGKSMRDKLKSLGHVRTVDMVRREFLDYTRPEKLMEYLEKGKPDYLINAAGYTGVPNVEACENNWQDCYFWNVLV